MPPHVSHVLVIEPDDVLRATLVRRLRYENYVAHGSTFDAEQMMALRRYPSDLVILDPAYDRSATKHRVVRLIGYCQERRVKTIVLTSAHRQSLAELTAQYTGIGASAVMAKPFSMPRLLDLVKQVLAT